MPTFGTFTDSRDGHVYKTVLMPDGKWWSEDLAWAGSGDTGNYGRMYTYAQALVSCPPGTHLPTKTEFDAMLATCGDPATAGTRIKSTVTWNASGVPLGTNTYGISANAGGFRTSTGSAIQLGGMKSYWWSATEATATTAYRLSFMHNAENYLFPDDVKTDLYSVRFIVNSNPVFSPAPGNYSTAQTVAINTSVGITYYTTDGSTPTTASSVYSGPISVSSTKTLKAINVYNGVTSAVVSATYTFPVFGTYTDARDGHVYRTVLMPDGKWWFAEDREGISNEWGNLFWVTYPPPVPDGCHSPTEAEWNAMFASVANPETVGRDLRSASSWETTIQSLDQYGFNAKPSGWIYYDTELGSPVYREQGTGAGWALGFDSGVDVNAPDFHNFVYLSGESLVPQFAEMVGSWAFAFRYIVDSGNVPDVVPQPSIYPPQGTYQGVQLAVLKSPQSLPIHYTLDGSEPTISSPLYTDPIPVYQDTHVKAAAFYGSIPSDTVTASYTITNGILKRIPSYRDRVLPYLLEQYKGDNP